ncbi:extracellular solute-binding protein [Streptococcus didelphis]|uniref:extracellular solute-binding protein n=1 Tax=Streptococcus didelphis TaxID=102886 RepID=UPI00036D2EC4|nr:extracellular solute-binding protein [Streptococcus didelphis]WMB30058.1 extracellular solute-binding protein [Streptococcus didelphis]
MKSWQKIIVGGASLTLASTLLVGCASGSKEKTESAASDSKTIKLWVPTGAKKSYADTVAKFEKDSGYKVKVVESEDPKAQEKIKKDASTAADVFSLPHDQLGQLVESGTIQEVPEQYSKDIAKTATEQAIVGAQYKGKTYAFPFGIESQVLYYNKEKLSPEDLTSYETITEKASFGGTFKQANSYVTGPLFMSVGNTLFGENGEDAKGTNWGNEKGVAVLKWIADQKNNKGFVSLDANNVMSKFGDGSVASFESGPWDYAAAQEAIGKDKLGVAVYPKVTIGGETVQQKAFLGVKLYAVNQAPANGDTKRIAASYKLASYLTDAESQEKQFKARNIVPSNKDVQASEAVQSNELAKTVITMGSSKDYTVVMPKLSQMATFWTESAAILSDAYNGKIKESDYLNKLKQFDKDIANAK